VLDPWNNTYYVLPCVLALGAWEPMRHRRPPLLALATVVATFITMERIFDVAPLDVVAAGYLAWSLPLVGFLAWRLYAPPLVVMPALSAGARPMPGGAGG
jgi:hypothetical protein